MRRRARTWFPSSFRLPLWGKPPRSAGEGALRTPDLPPTHRFRCGDHLRPLIRPCYGPSRPWPAVRRTLKKPLSQPATAAMHDIRALRDDPAAYVRGWSSRGVADAQGQVDAILDLDARLRAAQTAVQAAQAERNEASKKIGQAKAAKDEAEAARLMAHVETLKTTLEEQGELERTLKEELSGTGGVL